MGRTLICNIVGIMFDPVFSVSISIIVIQASESETASLNKIRTNVTPLNRVYPVDLLTEIKEAFQQRER
jgi:hypothetical protein